MKGISFQCYEILNWHFAEECFGYSLQLNPNLRRLKPSEQISTEMNLSMTLYTDEAMLNLYIVIITVIIKPSAFSQKKLLAMEWSNLLLTLQHIFQALQNKKKNDIVKR